MLYPALRRRAAAYWRGERRNHMLQPIALINKAYLRLVDQRSETLTDREYEAVADIAERVRRRFDYVVLSRNFTMQAFLWAQIADFYVCPYGTAQHKISWINPVPGIVHAGENKRPVAARDGAYHAVEGGTLPSFFFSAVTRNDSTANDGRKDLFSYELDVAAFATYVEAAVLARGRSSNPSPVSPI